MDRFTVRAELESPIIANGWLTLDSLLAGIVFEQTGDLAAAHETLPLMRNEGLWHASAALYEPSSFATPVFVAGLRAQHDLSPEDVAPMTKGKNKGKTPTPGLKRRREWGNVRSEYTARTTAAIWWFAEGDAGGVERLLEDVGAIGKGRTRGYGQLRLIELAPAKLNGLADDRGYPLRPVPVDLYQGPGDAVRAEEAWRPPYWKIENRTECVVPSTIEFEREHLEGFLA